jgi:glycine cleavage system H protein
MSSAEVKFTKDHEWIRLTGDEAEVGITDYAQRQLGDVVYVEAVSELFTPMSGEVTAVNTELTTKPEQVNSAPDTTWIIKLKLSAANEASELLTADQYDALTK